MRSGVFPSNPTQERMRKYNCQKKRLVSTTIISSTSKELHKWLWESQSAIAALNPSVFFLLSLLGSRRVLRRSLLHMIPLCNSESNFWESSVLLNMTLTRSRGAHTKYTLTVQAVSLLSGKRLARILILVNFLGYGTTVPGRWLSLSPFKPSRRSALLFCAATRSCSSAEWSWNN